MHFIGKLEILYTFATNILNKTQKDEKEFIDFSMFFGYGGVYIRPGW